MNDIESVTSWVRLWGSLALVAQVILSVGLVALWELLNRRSEDLANLVEEVAALREESARDDLTGVYRRGHGEQLAALALRVMPCAVVFLDLDGFGRLNKRRGHAEGDRALQRVASQLMATFQREHDIIYRYGGDEFVLVLPALAADPHAVDAGAQGDPLDRVLRYAAAQLALLSADVVPFTFAIANSRDHGSAEALRVAERDVRDLKNRRYQLSDASHALAASQPVPKEPEPHEPPVVPPAAVA